MKKPAVLIALSVLIATAAFAQQKSNAPLGARLKMHWKDATVYLSEGAVSHTLEIRDHFHAVQLSKVVLQSAKEAGDFIYLLLDATGPSKVPGDSHQCGAGTESDLIWLKLDNGWKIMDAKNFRYDSCWATISADDPPKWEGDTLKVTVFSVTNGESKTLAASYTYKHPEDGLKVVEVAETK